MLVLSIVKDAFRHTGVLKRPFHSGLRAGRVDGSSEKSPEASHTASMAQLIHTTSLLAFPLCIDTYTTESRQKSRKIESLHSNSQSNNSLVKLRQF